MKFEPWNYLLNATHNAKFHFDLTMYVVSADTQFATVTEKTIPGSCFPDNAETLVRRGGITNHHSIAYSISNICAKNYDNRLMCVEVIVCKR